MKYFLWSQHLNNVSPDIVADVSGRYKEVLETKDRNKIIAMISSITSLKSVLTNKSLYSAAYLRNNDIVFDVEAEEKDSGGRTSNITGYYKGFKFSAQDGWKDLVEKVKDFASRNDRSISEKALADLVTCLNIIQEKKKSKKVRKVFLVTGLVLLSLLIAVLLYQNYRGRLEQSINGVKNEQSESNPQ